MNNKIIEGDVFRLTLAQYRETGNLYLLVEEQGHDGKFEYFDVHDLIISLLSEE